MVDDGSELPEGAAIQTVCRGQKQPTKSYSDSKGNFSFELGSNRPAMINSAGMTDADTSGANMSGDNSWNFPTRGPSLPWQDCELQASLPGFTSSSIPLASKILLGENNDVGKIVLHRISGVDGFTVSATTAAAPSKAKKAYDKARDYEKKDRLDDAEKSLQQAVEIYPQYAIAWFELGQIQSHRANVDAARNSYNRAVEADHTYINPYQGLAELAFIAKQWQDLVTITNKIVALNAVSFPGAWFMNAVGHYCTNEFEAAEQSARQGLKLDVDHHLPKLQYVLAMALTKRGQYQEAAVQLRQYLQHETKAPEIAAAQKDLANAERLSASANATPPAEPK